MFWIDYGDRKVSDYRATRAENYHHPRYLMLNLLSLERMISRGGRITGMFGL
ncbi:MAG: hypothetical protein WD317_02745 [Balneolaceae bacterium]